MARTDYEIVVVDTIPQKFPPASDLVKAGVPLRVAQEWAKVRRAVSPAGLKRRLREQVN